MIILSSRHVDRIKNCRLYQTHLATPIPCSRYHTDEQSAHQKNNMYRLPQSKPLQSILLAPQLTENKGENHHTRLPEDENTLFYCEWELPETEK